MDLDHLQRLATELGALEEFLNSLKEQEKRITAAASLSESSAQELQRLSERFYLLKSEIDARQRRTLSNLTHDPSLEKTVGNGAENDLLLEVDDNERFNRVLPSGWERGVTDEKIPYYLNHASEETQWDHPEFTSLMANLLEMNSVKYSAYRLALKLRKVQQRLCLDLLDVEAAVFAFNEHGLTQERHDMAIRVPEMTIVLSSMFVALKREEPSEVDVSLCVDLCLNWLLNVFDSGRVGEIRVLAFKIGILILCRGPLTEKYLHLFKLVATSKRVSPRQLGLLLHDTMQIPKYLGEVAAFGGSNVEPSVQSCFLATKKSKESSSKSKEKARQVLDTIDGKHFLRWLHNEPQSLVWLPVLHRLASAELAKHHHTKCKVCKANPIVGFRYHCLKCFNFDLCHNCFFVGRTAKGHKADHPMQEYCTSTGATENFRNFGQAFRNSFRSKKYFQKKQKKLGYLPVKTNLEGEAEVNGANTSSSVPALSSTMNSGENSMSNSFNSTLNPKVMNGDVEEKRKKKSPKNKDEHDLIADMCKLLNDSVDNGEPGDQNGNVSVDSGKRSTTDNSSETNLLRRLDEGEDLETIITDLEAQGRKHNREYEDLKISLQGQKAKESADEIQSDTLSRKLRRETSRMEARMKILENHNRKLEAHIERLRYYKDNHADYRVGDAGEENHFGTLQAKSIVASDLYTDDPSTDDGKLSGWRRILFGIPILK